MLSNIHIYTSYFGNLKNISNPIAIVAKTPKFYNNKQYKELAPNYNIVMDYKNGKISKSDYTTLYYEQILSKFAPLILVQNLLNLFGNNITLLCYEKPGEFCHRRIVAQYIQHGTGLIIPEL